MSGGGGGGGGGCGAVVVTIVGGASLRISRTCMRAAVARRSVRVACINSASVTAASTHSALRSSGAGIAPAPFRMAYVAVAPVAV